MEFDAAESYGLRVQACGRIRRYGQKYDVEKFELNCENSFQNGILC